MKYLFDIINATLLFIYDKNSNKRFFELWIEKKLIESIKDVLGEISFEIIRITNCENLKRIHWNAFVRQRKFQFLIVGICYPTC